MTSGSKGKVSVSSAEFRTQAEENIRIFRETIARKLPHIALLSGELLESETQRSYLLSEFRHALRIFVLCRYFLCFAEDAISGSNTNESFPTFKSFAEQWSEYFEQFNDAKSGAMVASISHAFSSVFKVDESGFLEAFTNASTKEDVARVFAEAISEKDPEASADDVQARLLDQLSKRKDSSEKLVADSISELWKAPLPKTDEGAVDRCLAFLEADENWHYWSVFFGKLFSGEQPSLELAEQISKIPDEIWMTGLRLLLSELRPYQQL
ncbi:hypothetical protein L0664_15565 [Octadecabacter sp. G9-8]|uniref:Uncharacterized protein n=1 Tax=Octadecabacter dasysiphoniae TaxID=2909341 RepID=A0ABS9D2F4_9RHOB|nr:hypothetical protein [Octadecabacter dasysiphoniae]MCF2872493.1 hypothetical protein [Octadecabacter dasysiphoniae]